LFGPLELLSNSLTKVQACAGKVEGMTAAVAPSIVTAAAALIRVVISIRNTHATGTS
jgi:hypothetical protein